MSVEEDFGIAAPSDPEVQLQMDHSSLSLEEMMYLQGITEEDEALEGGEKPFSYFDLLDRPRHLSEPSELTFGHLKQISYELGLIKLCWPEIKEPVFGDRTNFPESYLKNSDKEKLLLLYTENFRQQFCYNHPHRKPLFLACENECGMEKMVCTTIQPTTLAYSELQSWENLVKFVGDHFTYEPLDEPTFIDLCPFIFWYFCSQDMPYYGKVNSCRGWLFDYNIEK